MSTFRFVVVCCVAVVWIELCRVRGSGVLKGILLGPVSRGVSERPHTRVRGTLYIATKCRPCM